jgi:hypothetical protein
LNKMIKNVMTHSTPDRASSDRGEGVPVIRVAAAT